MYAWNRHFADKGTLTRFFKEQLQLDYVGLGFYLSNQESVLVTVEDRHGERMSWAPKPEKDSRYNVYVFNAPIERTIFGSLDVIIAFDGRTEGK